MTHTDIAAVAVAELPKLFGHLGFKAGPSGTMLRGREGLVEGFRLECDRSATRFALAVGLRLPWASSRAAALNGADSGGFAVTRLLGELRFPSAPPVYYHFRTEGQLLDAFRVMYADFLNQAIPWYLSYLGPENVVAEYARLRVNMSIETDPSIPPNPHIYAMYGWMLQETGHQDEARHWLRKAYDQVSRPLFIDSCGRFVPRETKGARPYLPSVLDARLRELVATEGQ
jgi:hypothetical protein